MTPGPDQLRYRRVERCVFRHLRDSVLVTAPDRQFHLLAGSAAVVFDRLDRPGTLDDLVGRIAGDPDLSTAHDVTAEIPVLRQRVEESIFHLVQVGIVEVEPRPPSVEGSGPS